MFTGMENLLPGIIIVLGGKAMQHRVPDKEEHKNLDLINDRLDDLTRAMEKTGIAEYVEMLNRPRRLLFLNFGIGIARGFGMAVGFTMLTALVLYFLRQIILLNIPVIGKFIADLVEIVQTELSF